MVNPTVEETVKKLVPADMVDEFHRWVESGKASRAFLKKAKRTPEIRVAYATVMAANMQDLMAFRGTLRESWPKEFIMSQNDLTQAEINHINRHHTCPVCKQGTFLEGPWGGSSVNVKCNDCYCGKEFWLGLVDGTVWSGGRIDRNEPGLYKGDFKAFAPPRIRKVMKLIKVIGVLAVLAAIALVIYLFMIP